MRSVVAKIPRELSQEPKINWGQFRVSKITHYKKNHLPPWLNSTDYLTLADAKLFVRSFTSALLRISNYRRRGKICWTNNALLLSLYHKQSKTRFFVELLKIKMRFDVTVFSSAQFEFVLGSTYLLPKLQTQFYFFCKYNG